ncbi:hypothetical protein BJL95_08790 [Methylomonas sp. LWB]|uniref:hypothetical protein n=1 Tax=Methylomonas sp. LWB TaxID=1905845 RepID=UPI0008DB0745|nr:hypothetical protein [Methylomonas sp. LWB]OHX38390.1 hypothetical protein BJL95_08790 [Methylomonas sp. LWB]
MRGSSGWKRAALLCAVFFSGAVAAVTPDEEEKQQCKKPKFRDFAPAHMAEVAPGVPLSFHVSPNADPFTITAEARGEKMKVDVVNKKTFYLVNTTLPVLSGGFARIHVTAKAAESKTIASGCLGQDGWLLKIKGAEAPAKTAVAPAAQ